MYMKKVWLYMIIVIILGVLVYRYIDSKRCFEYSCVSFMDKGRYVVEEEYESSSDVYRAMLRNGNTRIRIEAYSHIPESEVESHNTIKVMNIESVYETAKSPYPGALSNEIECGAEYRPRIGKTKINTMDMTYIQGYLNERFQLGSCIKDEVKYNSYLALFHCATQDKWYQFEIITPINQEMQYKEVVDSIRCE